MAVERKGGQGAGAETDYLFLVHVKPAHSRFYQPGENGPYEAAKSHNLTSELFSVPVLDALCDILEEAASMAKACSGLAGAKTLSVSEQWRMFGPRRKIELSDLAASFMHCARKRRAATRVSQEGSI